MGVRYFRMTMLFAVAAALLAACSPDKNTQRKIISLDGTWEIEDSDSLTVPGEYTHTLVIPGYVDMSVPEFKNAGRKDPIRKYYWLKRHFSLSGPDSYPLAFVKIPQAGYGYTVYLNGKEAGESSSCFTPTFFDVRKYLRQGDNEITVRLGAWRDNVPDSMPDGWDKEKEYYYSGIFDNVNLILSRMPYIRNIQVVPEPGDSAIGVVAWLMTDHEMPVTLDYSVTGFTSGNMAASGRSHTRRITGEDTMVFRVRIPDFKWWSPESPFLYRLTLSTGSDNMSARFGMRTFRFDSFTGKAMLNGKPYFMRGTNFCYRRFSEDPLRKRLPWDTAWVANLYQKMKDCHMNTVRHCIGFPPELWYEIADEKGILVQDEFPLWYSLSWPAGLKPRALETEFKKWMEDRWNHPSVVIWDAQNECWIDSTRQVIHKVRTLDYSDRPWDNGYGMPDRKTDARESHPYRFHHATYDEPPFSINQLENETGEPDVPFMTTKPDGTLWFVPEFIKGVHPFVINEYGWLWLDRDGTPSTLGEKVYRSLLGPHSTTAQRRETYARNLAALTEFWRGNRQAAAIMYFCFLAYSRPDGPKVSTSDNFTDLRSLTLDPYFKKYVVDAFSPVGLMTDKWDTDFKPDRKLTIPVTVINDLETPWEGNVCFFVDSGLQRQSRNVTLPPYGKTQITFNLLTPHQPGRYLMTSQLIFQGDTISSLRDMNIR